MPGEKIDSEFGPYREIYLQKLKELRLIDDDFMAVVFEDIPCTELLLRVILERDDLIVKEVHPQYELKNLEGRSVRLDIFAIDKENKAYNIEVQRKDSGADPKRARYNSSLIDAHISEPGENYNAIADTYVIFITENDVLKYGLPIYHIERTIKENGKDFSDGSHIVYVNSKIRDESALGRLMHDFFCTNPKDMYYQALSERTKYFKESEKGVTDMCQIWQDIKNDGYKEGLVKGEKNGEKKKAKETAAALFQKGWSSDQIVEIVGYDSATVEKWIRDYESSFSAENEE